MVRCTLLDGMSILGYIIYTQNKVNHAYFFLRISYIYTNQHIKLNTDITQLKKKKNHKDLRHIISQFTIELYAKIKYQNEGN
jgi:hypothetical protein